MSVTELPEWNGKRKGRALIVEGGGMRGAFTGGVLASMVVHHGPDNYDIVVAVSSGSCAASYYVTETEMDPVLSTRFVMIWRNELYGSRLMSFRNWLKGRSFLNQDYLIDYLFGDKYRLKSERLDEPETTPFYVVVSNLRTGRPEYHRGTSRNILPLLKAATALPLATPGRRRLGKNMYTDGGVMDPVPLRAVINAGYRDITMVLTNPRSFRTKAYGGMVGTLCYPFDPKAARALTKIQHRRYNDAYEILNNPPPGIDMRVIDPAIPVPAGLLDTDVSLLNQSVDLGIDAGIRAFTRTRNGLRARLGNLWSRIRSRLAFS